MTLFDAHMTGAGYLASPRDGTLADLQERLADLLEAAGVGGVRRLGCSAELRGASERMDAMGQAWSLPAFDRRYEGPRAIRRCLGAADGERGVRASVAEGAGWVLLGRHLDAAVAAAAAGAARRAHLRVAAEAGVADEALLATGSLDTVEGLVDLLAGPERREVPTWERVSSLARDRQSWPRRLEAILAAGVVVVPLLLRSRRASVIEEAVRAPGLAELAGILPHHAYLIQMQNPGGVRFARRHVREHLGMTVLDRAQRREFAAGWDRVLDALRELVSAGVKLAGGSGAPALGMCPGIALHEERALWRGAGLDESLVEDAFADGGRSRCGAAPLRDAEETPAMSGRQQGAGP